MTKRRQRAILSFIEAVEKGENHYEEKDNLDRISAQIIVEHDTQKGIIIGKNASMLKKIGTDARKEIELTADKKVYLDLQVKVVKDWRKKSKDIDSMY